MCGRFTLRSDGNALAQHFGLEPEAVAALPAARYNIAPTQQVPMVRRGNSGRRELAMARWGLVPHWSQGNPSPPTLFNARSETAASKPAFRDAFRARRCLIPADGFYEWKAIGKSKQPWYVHLPGDGLFAFAGLWEGETCTILTRAPTPALAGLHDRMPAVPAPADYDAWLDPAPRPAAELLALLEQAPDWQLYPVRPLVNRAAADSAACIEPLPALR